MLDGSPAENAELPLTLDRLEGGHRPRWYSRPMDRRDAVPAILITMAVGLFGGLAWLTQNPDAAILEDAQEWRYVGPLAKKFRQAYLGPDELAEESAEQAPELEGEPGSEPESQRNRRRAAAPSEPLHIGNGVKPPVRRLPPAATPPTRSKIRAAPVTGTPATTVPQAADPDADNLPTFSTEIASIGVGESSQPRQEPRLPAASTRYVAIDWFWVMPGNQIRSAAHSDAEVLANFNRLARLPVLKQQGSWAQVLFRGEEGWVDTAWQPPHPEKGARQSLLRHKRQPVQWSDEERLDKAREILGIEKPTGKLGSYQLYSDVTDRELLELLDEAAKAAQGAYFARYGRLPSGEPKRAVVLFTKQADYRRYSEEANVPFSTHTGHAGNGLLATYVGKRPSSDLAGTLIHEIAHLLNDRSLAWALPPWLEEGIATDLGEVWLENLEGGAGRGVMISSQQVGIFRLAATQEAGDLPSAGLLTRLNRDAFYRSPGYSYAHSAALIRFLLEGDDGKHQDSFREFLKRIAYGRAADSKMLLKLLGLEAEELDETFGHWLRLEAEAAQQSIQGDIGRAIRR